MLTHEERRALELAMRSLQDAFFIALIPLFVPLFKRLRLRFKPRWQALIDARDR